MRRTAAIILTMLALVVIVPLAATQAPPPQAPGAPGQAPGGRARAGMQALPRLVSPDIGPDNTVTFRLRAPNATVVVLNGDWPEGRNVTMVKDADGVWSAKVGPLTPELWGYTFSVNGVSTLDPANANIRRDGTRYANIFFIDGPLSQNYQIRDIPHGNVNMVWYDSPTLKLRRRMYVYTPAGYDDGKQPLPVLYLLHGAGGDEDAWFNMGRASLIMDGLIADKTAKPMIVVMTNGNGYQQMAPGFGPLPRVEGAMPQPAPRGAGPGAPGAPPAAAAPAAATPPGAPATTAAPAAPGARGAAGGRGAAFGGLFPESIVKDVIPYIESHYRVTRNKDGRAIAGLSMGGGHTLAATNAHPETFSYIGVFSMGTRDDITDRLQAIKKAGLKFYYVGCGKQDQICVEGSKNLDALLTKVGINHTFNFSEGGHTWANWRLYLSEIAPRLFQ